MNCEWGLKGITFLPRDLSIVWVGGRDYAFGTIEIYRDMQECIAGSPSGLGDFSGPASDPGNLRSALRVGLAPFCPR
jgi:hypothetical protein